MTNWIGQQLGNYRLVDLIGQGSFADVYLGEHLQHGSFAAIKVLQVHLDDPEQFHAETRTLAKLMHPHIIRVLDAGLENGVPFLVMDYAAGGTLRQRHPIGTMLPLPRIISYVQQIATALQYAHEQKMIHRDVKPGNMFIGEHGTILLGDFGLALSMQGSSAAMPHEIAGTVPYMAPEQLMGQPCYASDQYSLAAVVYEWLCGIQPLYDLDGQPMHSAPLPLHERVPGIASAVEEVVLIGLSPDAEQRFVNVRAFASALEQAATGNFFDTRLIAHSSESDLSILTDEVVAEQDATKAINDEPAVTLVASADMSLISKTIQVSPAGRKNPITMPPFVGEWISSEGKLEPLPHAQSAGSKTNDQGRTHSTGNTASNERKSSSHSISAPDMEQDKKPSSVLAAMIFILLILIIIGGIFAALRLFT